MGIRSDTALAGSRALPRVTPLSLYFWRDASYSLLEMRVRGGVQGVGVVVGSVVVVGAPGRPVGCVMVLTVVPCVDPKDGRDDGVGIPGMVGFHGDLFLMRSNNSLRFGTGTCAGVSC